MPFEMPVLKKYSKAVLILLATLCIALSATALTSHGRTTSEAEESPERPPTIAEAPDPATPFLVGAGLVTLSIVIRRRRRLRSKEAPAAKINGREHS